VSESKSKGGDKSILRIRPEDHELLQKLKAFQYPDKSLGEILAIELGPTVEKHRDLLERIDQLRMRYPDKSLTELRQLVTASGIDALLSAPPSDPEKT
jgi:hypothetical protein